MEIWINFGVSKQIPKSTKIATIPEGYWPGSAFYVFVPTGTKDYPINVNSNGVITSMEAIPADTITEYTKFILQNNYFHVPVHRKLREPDTVVLAPPKPNNLMFFQISASALCGPHASV